MKNPGNKKTATAVAASALLFGASCPTALFAQSDNVVMSLGEVVVTAKGGVDFIIALRLTRLAIVSADSKAKEPAKEVVTLNASQGAKYAAQIADITSTIYDYEKQFAKVEAAVAVP